MDHFTYKNDIDLNCLQQGDVLRKSPELTKILEEVHPHFDSPDYNYFLVLTQSCDLVKRNNGKTNSKYITIAVIRPLEIAIKREAEGILSSKLEKITKKIIDEKNNNKLSETLTRLFNNNIHDYFYLHSEMEAGFTIPSVAFLRVSIALKSELHYDVCLSCKILELEDNFKSKLGWLVGNLYSRVGTLDWEPAELRKFVKSQISSFFSIKPNIAEIELELAKHVSDDELRQKSPDEIIQIIQKIKIPTRKDKVIERLQEIIINSNALREDYDISKLVTKFKNDESLTSSLK